MVQKKQTEKNEWFIFRYDTSAHLTSSKLIVPRINLSRLVWPTDANIIFLSFIQIFLNSGRFVQPSCSPYKLIIVAIVRPIELSYFRNCFVIVPPGFERIRFTFYMHMPSNNYTIINEAVTWQQQQLLLKVEPLQINPIAGHPHFHTYNCSNEQGQLN